MSGALVESGQMGVPMLEVADLDGAPLVEHAAAYARAGFEVMPRREARGRLVDVLTGSPRVGLLGEAEVQAFWAAHPDTPAMAVVCGPTSNIFVIDVDQHPGGADGLAELRALEDHHGRLPATPFTLTPSGRGRHLYFKWPVGRRLRNGTMAPGLEVLGDRAAATLPPSTKGGRGYLWSLSRHPDFLAFADAPAWLVGLATPPPLRARRGHPEIRASGRDRYLETALERELEAVRTARPGARNNMLNRAAWALGRFGGDIDAGEIEDLLLDAARCAGLPAREASATVRSALRRRAAR